jgi:glycosyltransferase involved in cell wall biosynthesis
MRILSLGLDRSVLDPNSKTAKRVFEYKNLVEKYIVLVPEKSNKILALFDLYRRAKKVIEREGINVITVQDQYFLGLMAYLLAKKYKIGLNIQIHGFEKFFGVRKWISQSLIPRANSIRVVSQRLKNLLIKDFGVREEKITVVPIYAEISNDVSRIPASNHSGESGNLASAGKNKDKFVFLTVGRLVPVKNIGLQIEAMKEVVKKYPQAELWIVGDGPEMNNLKLKIKNFSPKADQSLTEKLENKVSLLGWQENVGNYYKRADAFLLTSNSEGWGIAVIEAASYGLPIIMTNVGLAGEVIVNNESGLVIPVGDKEALITAMIKIIENKELRSKLSIGAKEVIKKLPSKEEILELYKESWRKAIEL